MLKDVDYTVKISIGRGNKQTRMHDRTKSKDSDKSTKEA